MKVVIHDIGVELHLVDLQGSLELVSRKIAFSLVPPAGHVIVPRTAIDKEQETDANLGDPRRKLLNRRRL
jgi:hypothetical protein